MFIYKATLKKLLLILLPVILFFSFIVWAREWTSVWETRGKYVLQIEDYIPLSISAYSNVCCRDHCRGLVFLRKYWDFNEVRFYNLDGRSYDIHGKPNQFYKFMRRYLW
jgi:hypothetical protein